MVEKKLRVLAYSCNGTGMGHITRTMAISRRIKSLAKAANIDPEIFLLTSSEAVSVAHREKFISFKIPSYHLIKRLLPEFMGEFRNAQNNFEGVAQRVSLSIMEEINPDILILDNNTTGYLKEFMVSDILDRVHTPVFIYRERRSERVTSDFLDYMPKYNVIIAPHPEGTQLIVPTGLEDRLHHVGNIMIRDKSEALDRERVQSTFQMDPDCSNIYVTAGGGGDKKHNGTIAKIIDSIGTDDVMIYVGLGTLHQGQRPAFGERGRVIVHYPIVEMFNGFDGAVSAAGYNSVSELLHLGVPTILYPQKRNVDDQESRVERLNEIGAVIGIDNVNNPDSLKEAFEKIRDPIVAAELRKTAMATVPHNGAWKAAYRILEDIATDSQLKQMRDQYSHKLNL